MTTAAENAILTQTGPGTALGELFLCFGQEFLGGLDSFRNARRLRF